MRPPGERVGEAAAPSTRMTSMTPPPWAAGLSEARASGAVAPVRRHARPRGAGAPATAGYRHDLDGLRAVAVLLVAVYHVWVHRVSGGVDVFLMLSGFFVGGGLLRSFARGAPVRLRDYLPRLARRLLPALVVVLAAVLVASMVWLPRTRWGDVSGETLASLLYVENWRLAVGEHTYGAADAMQSPLQHVWSLSVQGQVFVGVPLLLLAVWWCTRRWASPARLSAVHATVVVLAVASFFYALVSVRLDQSFAYYDTFARLWEYLTGTLLALAVVRARVSRGWSVVGGWVGVAVLLAAGLVVDGGSSFPGPAALVPVAGAALVVLAGATSDGRLPRGSVSRLLASTPVARAGGYAYTFYLWHWPVLVFAIVVRDRPVGWLAGTAVLLVAGALAYATRRWVEVPLRSATPRPRTDGLRGLRVAVAVAVALAVALPLGWFGQLEIQRRSFSTVDTASFEGFPGAMEVAAPGVFSVEKAATPVPDPVTAPFDVALPTRDECVTYNEDTTVVRCTYGDETARTVVAVVGNSHAEQWVDALSGIGSVSGFRVVTYLKGGCPFSLDTPEENPWQSCRDWNTEVVEELVESPPDAVFTIGTRYSWNDDSIPGNEFVPPGYVRAWEALDAVGVQVVALRDTPWLLESAPDCVAVSNDPTVCAVEATSVLDVRSPADDMELPANVALVDLNDIVCFDGVCPYVQGNRMVYRDNNHLTQAYVRSIAPVLEERVRDVLPVF